MCDYLANVLGNLCTKVDIRGSDDLLMRTAIKRDASGNKKGRVEYLINLCKRLGYVPYTMEQIEQLKK